VWQIVATILRDPVFLPSVTQTAATFLHYVNRPYPAQGSPLWYDAAAELIAATSGLGYLIQQAGDYLNTALVLSGIICIAVIALILDAGLRGLLLADPCRRG
jgi:hypothetical protein